MRPVAAQHQDRLSHLRRHPPAVVMRRPRPIIQPLGTAGPIALKPFVAGLAADPEGLAQPGHRRFISQTGRHKGNTLVHGTGLFPRHRPPPGQCIDLSPMYPVCRVTYLSGPDPGHAPPPPAQR